MCYLLFPDIGLRHKESRWGDSLFWRSVVLLLGFFFQLPDFVKLIMVTYIVRFLSISPCFVKSFLKNISPTVIEKVEFLRNISDNNIEKLDGDFIKGNSGILKFYCGKDDQNTQTVLKELLPEQNLFVDQDDVGEHFTVYHSFKMAEEVKKMMMET
uniref:Uncharacterized protein n=1 Tax=Megaselia scalaris TaxID=36166 RepID=T1GVV5_MEGSC